MNRKSIAALLVCWLGCATSFGQKSGQSMQSFPLQAVRLKASPFQQAQQTDLNYILALNPDRLLAPYLREAGLKPKAASYPNWENTGLDGHIGGHYLSALALMYASTGNATIKQRLDYFLAELQMCQEASGDGYVGGVPGSRAMWAEIGKGKINASTFSLNDRWVPLYNIHKIFSGLYDAYAVAGDAKAKIMLIKLTDWFLNLTANLSDQQAQTMLISEHGGLNEVFANVYSITKDQKYLDLSRKFSHRAILSPLLAQKDRLTGIHANTQIPKIIGFERIAELASDTAWHHAATFFWDNVVHHRTVAIGGNSVREHFNPTDNFLPMIESREGPETCNSYNMLKLTKELFLAEPSAAYMDYYERTLYNHILSSQRPEGGFVYFTPIRPGHYRAYAAPQESFWCCVGSGLENHGKYGELIYAHTADDLYVNLFLASELTWKEKGLELIQENQFPNAETSRIKLKLGKSQRFAINFRVPAWINDGKLTISVNGVKQDAPRSSNGYARLERKWRTGDVIELALPMHTYTEFLPDGSNWASFLHGPIVLAADMGKKDLIGETADDSRMGHIAAGPLLPLDEAPLLVASDKQLEKGLQADATPLHFSADKLIYQAKYKNLKLVPFYTLQNTRYTIYWPYTSTQELPALVAKMTEKERAAQVLDSLTVDWVAPGEQQPETDHQFKGAQTETGIHAERHYRAGTGWFSYVLRNPKKAAQKLRLTFYGTDRARNFKIYINGQELESKLLDGKSGEKLIDIDYPLTATMKTSTSLEVKFVAAEKSAIARIFEVRLLQ